jgi:phosphoglycerate kinase
MAYNKIEQYIANNDVAGKKVLVRVDFNVPMKDGIITDDTRLLSALPTISLLVKNGAKTILLSHFGRPKGKIDPTMSLAPIAPALAKLLGKNVGFAADLKGEIAQSAIDNMQNGDVLILENSRFYAGEEKNDPELAKEVAKLGDLYVNDAFSAAHRAHVTTEGVAKLLPSFAGLAMARELDHLNQALGTPIRPVLAIVGGAKVSSKIDLLENLVTKVDYLAIGGGMANTFLAADGVNIGKSLCEKDLLDKANEIKAAAAKAGCTIVLPVDVVNSKEFAPNPPTRICEPNETQDDEMILDAGPKSVIALAQIMEKSKTIIWNGPLGAFETPPFDIATVDAAKAAAKLCKSGAVTVVAGGGDTVSAVNHAGVADDFSFISTAGGAFLEWMEGKELPGVKALEA